MDDWNFMLDDFVGGTGGNNVGFNYGNNNSNSGGLFDSLMSGLGDIDGADWLKGLGTAFQAYNGYQLTQDSMKNNSLYRRLMEEEDEYKNKFRDSWSAGGGTNAASVPTTANYIG